MRRDPAGLNILPVLPLIALKPADCGFIGALDCSNAVLGAVRSGALLIAIQ
jgi:hypothetical protein